MSDKNWISKALPKTSKGKLHRKLGVPEDEKISDKKLNAAEKKGGKIGKEATLAKTLSSFNRG